MARGLRDPVNGVCRTVASAKRIRELGFNLVRFEVLATVMIEVTVL